MHISCMQCLTKISCLEEGSSYHHSMATQGPTIMATAKTHQADSPGQMILRIGCINTCKIIVLSSVPSCIDQSTIIRCGPLSTQDAEPSS